MGDDHRRAVLEVRGMTCDDCARRVARALEGAGASDVSVSWRAGEASFSWPGRRGADRLRSAVAAAGYAPGELRLTGADAVANEGTVAREGADADLVNLYGFSVLRGHARFTGPDVVEVDGRRITARAFLVATGASPALPPVPGLAESGCLTSTTALEQTEVPDRLVVVGANAVGLELGQFFLHLGSKVAFVDVAPRIAPFEEPEASELLTEVLVRQDASLRTGAQVREVRRSSGHVDLTLEAAGQDVTPLADEVLVATGRRPNTADLGLDAAGVELDARDAVVVDAGLRTTNPRVYAAGDVTGGPQFVYLAAYEGVLAVDNALLGAGRTTDFTGLPRVTFTSPPVASAGLTEAQARDAGWDVETTLLPLDAMPAPS